MPHGAALPSFSGDGWHADPSWHLSAQPHCARPLCSLPPSRIPPTQRPIRRYSSWWIWKRSQWRSESYNPIHWVARLTYGWGCSRDDETEEPVHPVGESQSTHAGKNLRGRCVYHASSISLDVEIWSRRRKNSRGVADSRKGSPLGYG